MTTSLQLSRFSHKWRTVVPTLNKLAQVEEQLRFTFLVLDFALAIAALLIPAAHVWPLLPLTLLLMVHLVLLCAKSVLDYVPSVPRSLGSRALDGLLQNPEGLSHRQVSQQTDLDDLYEVICKVVPMSTAPDAERYYKVQEWLRCDPTSFYFVCRNLGGEQHIVGFTSVIALSDEAAENIEEGTWSPFDGNVIPVSGQSNHVFVHGAFLDQPLRSSFGLDFYRLLVRHVAEKSTPCIKTILVIPLTRRGIRACARFSVSRTNRKSPRKNRIYALHLRTRPDFVSKLNRIRQQL